MITLKTQSQTVIQVSAAEAAAASCEGKLSIQQLFPFTGRLFRSQQLSLLINYFHSSLSDF